MTAGLRVLAIDDEPPALDELVYLLRADPRVGAVSSASDATAALRVLRDVTVDAVFLDIRMPGLDGMELARVLAKFAVPPAIVFVTAFDDRAAEAFDLGVVDYVRKPVRADRLAESLRRVITSRMLPRSAVRWVEAQGDYARLHTADGSHLVRVPLATLAERWSDAGFVRIHRSFLVQLPCITELRLSGTGWVVVVDANELPVSRRHIHHLRDRLVRSAKQSWSR